MTRVLAFDVALNSTGWAFGHPAMERPHWGTWKPRRWGIDKDTETARFRDFAAALVVEHKPALVLYEQPWANRATLDFAFTEAQCALVSQLWVIAHDREIRVAHVMPNIWQQAVTGRMKAPDAAPKAGKRAFWKSEAMRVCRERNWFVVSQDEADACCIMLYGLILEDRVFASRQGPLFRRAELQAEREARP